MVIYLAVHHHFWSDVCSHMVEQFCSVATDLSMELEAGEVQVLNTWVMARVAEG